MRRRTITSNISSVSIAPHSCNRWKQAQNRAPMKHTQGARPMKDSSTRRPGASDWSPRCCPWFSVRRAGRTEMAGNRNAVACHRASRAVGNPDRDAAAGRAQFRSHCPAAGRRRTHPGLAVAIVQNGRVLSARGYMASPTRATASRWTRIPCSASHPCPSPSPAPSPACWSTMACCAGTTGSPTTCRASGTCRRRTPAAGHRRRPAQPPHRPDPQRPRPRPEGNADFNALP